MKTKITLSVMVFLLATFFTTAQTIISAGAVEGTWTQNASPYIIVGAINVADGTTLTIEPGVVVYFKTIEPFQIEGCLLAEGTIQDSILFTNNNPEIRWGGIFWDETPLNNDSSKIAYSIFEYAYGYPDGDVGNTMGAIGIRNFDNLSILNTTFRHNLVDQDGTYPPSGGAIGLWNSSIFISHCIFYDNKAKYGGAILYYMGSDAITDNCLFYENTATAYGGAIEVWSNSNPYFINCTFADNYSGISGGALDVYTSMPHLTNCIMWGNNSNTGYNQVNIQSGSAGLNIYHCDIQGSEEGIGGFPNNGEIVNIFDVDPEFIGSGDFPYSFSDINSPCIDCGTLDIAYLPTDWECPCVDLASEDRIYDNIVIDLGAYENQGPTSVVNKITNDINMSIYPNPVSSTCILSYQLTKDQMVKIDLYSVTGQIIEIMKFQKTTAGTHQYQIDLSSLPNGYYLLKLQVGNEVVTRKVVKL